MAAQPPKDGPIHPLPPQVSRPLKLTLAGLWAERLTRAFWPLWVIVLLAFSAAAFGLHEHGSLLAFRLELAAIGLATVAALIWGIRQFKAPSRREALARLDASLPGRPLAALSDAQVVGQDDPASAAVWQAHLARMAERAKAARAVEPDLKLSSRDPYALRYVALTAAVMAAGFGSFWRAAEVTNLGAGPAQAIPSGPSWEAWARPPAYTGKPRLYLNDITAPGIDLPIGSKIQIRFYGEENRHQISQDIAQTSAPPEAGDSAAAAVPKGLAGLTELTVSQSGRLSISGNGGRDWQVNVIPDLAPSVEVAGPMGREADGRFKQPYKAQDDYGVTGGQITFALDLAQVTRSHGLAIDPEPIAPITLDMPMPLSGKRDQISDQMVDDLSKSVLSNMPVSLRLSVSDAIKQLGQSPETSAILPGKRFFEPHAAAVIELRRDLLWNRANAARSSQLLKALIHRSEELSRAQNAAKRARVLVRAMDKALAAGPLSDQTRDEFAEELWLIAFMFETGDLGNAAANLQRAQDRLEEAIRNGASPEEIDQLMKEMQQAMRDYTRELGKQAQNGPPQANQGGQTITGDDLQRMLDKIEELMKEGRTAEAMALMEELRELMENLQVQQGQGQGEGEQGEGGAMGQLRDTLRDQQGLSDEAYRDMQRGRSGGESGNPEDFADRQRDLRQRLQDLQNGQLPGDGSEKGEEGRDSLGRAEQAMREAEERLKDGDLSGALDKQAEALREMRDGARDLEEGERQKNREAGLDNGNDPNTRDAQRVDPNATDPLGREPGDAARIGSDRNMVENTPDERAKKLLDEIRRRSGEATRPEGELDYLKRLLDLF